MNVGAGPNAIAVDWEQNVAYIANFTSSSLTIIRSNSASTISVGLHPTTLAVNGATHTVYVVDRDYNRVSVVNNGAVTATLGAGTDPEAIAIDRITNKIYVANWDYNIVVIDGKTNNETTVSAGIVPNAIAVDELRNKIYVSNLDGPCLTVIDGKTNTSTTTGSIGNGTWAVNVNPLTNQVYVAIAYSNASQIGVFSGANGRFPPAAFDVLMGPVSSVR